MIIINSKILDANVPELKKYYDEYERGLKTLRANFPSGNIQLRRMGFPRPVKPQSEGAPLIMRENPAPIYMKLTKKVDGVKWSYVKGDYKVEANGLVTPDPSNDTIDLSGEIISLNHKEDPDYAFFFYYKSKQIGNNFYVFDPEGDAIREAKAEKDRKRVEGLIWNDFDDNKVVLMCDAYGIATKEKGGSDINADVLRKKLVTKVFAMEDDKRKHPTDLQKRGVAEFLMEAKADEITRPKQLLQIAIQEKKVVYKDGRFYLGDIDICTVPVMFQPIDKRQDYLATFLRTPNGAESWEMVLKETVDREYLDSLDKYGIWWLADQVGVRRNQQVPAIKQQVYEKFGISVEVPEGTAD